MTADARVAVVVITHQRRPELLRTLGLLRDLPERPHVVVVDNGSTDGSAEGLPALAQGPTVIRAGENLGFARACNSGAAAGLSLTGLVNLIQVYSYAGTDDEFMTGALPTLAARLGGFAATAFFILLAWTAASLTLGAQPHPVQHRESAPPPLPLPQPRWTMPEAVRLGLLSLGVLAVSLWNLGSTKAPQTPLEVLNGSQSVSTGRPSCDARRFCRLRPRRTPSSCAASMCTNTIAAAYTYPESPPIHRRLGHPTSPQPADRPSATAPSNSGC